MNDLSVTKLRQRRRRFSREFKEGVVAQCLEPGASVSRIALEEMDGPETFTRFPGGAPANVAVAVAKLGGRSYFAGKVGRDMFGDCLRDAMAAAGVRTDYLLQTDQAKTALAFVSLDARGERSFEFYRSPSADLLFRPEEFRPAWFAEPCVFRRT